MAKRRGILALILGILVSIQQSSVSAQGTHECRFRHSIISSNGHYVAASNGITIVLWDASTGTRKHSFPAEYSGFDNSPLSFSFDEKYLLINTRDNATLWDVETGAKVHTFAHDLNATRDAVQADFVPNTDYVLSADPDSAILWDIKTGRKLHSFPGIVDVEFNDLGNKVSISNDGNLLLMRDHNQEQYEWNLWNLKTFDKLQTIKTGDAVLAPNGKFIIAYTVNEHLKLIPTDNDKQKTVQHLEKIGESSAPHFYFSPDSNYLLTAEYPPGTTIMALWSLQTGKQIFEREGIPSAWEFLPDKQHLLITEPFHVSSDPSFDEKLSHSSILQVWSLKENKIKRQFEVGSWAVSLDISTDQKLLLIEYESAELELWDFETGKKLRTLC
jgi:WD40 repeat protein